MVALSRPRLRGAFRATRITAMSGVRIAGRSLAPLLLLLLLTPAQSQEAALVPGGVLGLFHTLNQPLTWFCALDRYDTRGSWKSGGDEKAPPGDGYFWWTPHDQPGTDPAAWRLPGGIVVGLIHTSHQSPLAATSFGLSAANGPWSYRGLQRYCGGDRGAPSGVGYCWYETTGSSGIDWQLVQRLPRGTVVGLKHSLNQPQKVFFWQGHAYDPADRRTGIPAGFVRRGGGDIGAPEGHGFYWFEKADGPRVLASAPQECGGRAGAFLAGAPSCVGAGGMPLCGGKADGFLDYPWNK